MEASCYRGRKRGQYSSLQVPRERSRARASAQGVPSRSVGSDISCRRIAGMALRNGQPLMRVAAGSVGAEEVLWNQAELAAAELENSSLRISRGFSGGQPSR